MFENRCVWLSFLNRFSNHLRVVWLFSGPEVLRFVRFQQSHPTLDAIDHKCSEAQARDSQGSGVQVLAWLWLCKFRDCNFSSLIFTLCWPKQLQKPNRAESSLWAQVLVRYTKTRSDESDQQSTAVWLTLFATKTRPTPHKHATRSEHQGRIIVHTQCVRYRYTQKCIRDS